MDVQSSEVNVACSLMSCMSEASAIGSLSTTAMRQNENDLLGLPAETVMPPNPPEAI